MNEHKYRERLLPNLGTFLAAAILLPAISLVLEPFSLNLGLIIGSSTVALIWLSLFLFAPVVWVTDGKLIAGKAQIPLSLLGKSEVVTKESIFLERGPKLSPTAFRLFQGSIRTALKIEVDDPSDPTPYWLISTRKPQELQRALKT